MNEFILSLKNPIKYSPRIIYLVLDNQVLVPENIDNIFTHEILTCVDEKIITRILLKYGSDLSKDNLINCYNEFKNNDNIIKLLIATNEYSKILIDTYNSDQRLPEYYITYQKKSDIMIYY